MIKEEQIAMDFIKEEEQREIDRINLLQYQNLREQFRRLINEVLGEGYYNMGMCNYSCDRFTVDDLIYKFKNNKRTIKLLMPVATISLVVNVILALIIIR